MYDSRLMCPYTKGPMQLYYDLYIFWFLGVARLFSMISGLTPPYMSYTKIFRRFINTAHQTYGPNGFMFTNYAKAGMLMAMGSRTRAMRFPLRHAAPFQLGSKWWVGGRILGSNFPPTEFHGKIFTHISEKVRPSVKRTTSSNRPPLYRWPCTSTRLIEIGRSLYFRQDFIFSTFPKSRLGLSW